MNARAFRYRQGRWQLGEKTYVLGILNLTPDSFSDGSRRYDDADFQVERVRELLADGADALDLGAESTRPGYQPIAWDEEWRRLAPTLRAVRQQFPQCPLSVDTSKVEVAERAIDEGADIINDVWGLSRDPALARAAARAGLGFIAMFNDPGDPAMPVSVQSMRQFFCRALTTALDQGLGGGQVLIDPGIGFRLQGDSIWEILTHLDDLAGLGAGILIGHSRKRFLGRVGAVDQPQDRDSLTAMVSLLAALNGADVVRVHNPRATRQALAIAHQWRKASGTDKA